MKTIKGFKAMNNDKKQDPHTVVIQYQGNGREPQCRYYYGEDKPADFPINVTENFRFTKASSNPVSSKPSLLQRLLSIV